MSIIPGSVTLTGVIAPTDTADVFPVIDPQYGIDGLRNVGTMSEMYDIPIERRRSGMVVGVLNLSGDSTNYFRLKPGVTWSVGTTSNTDWEPFLTAATSSLSLPIKYIITSETITVPSGYQYLIYGDLIIGTGGILDNYGKVTIINGTMSLTGGTFSNNGTFSIVTLAQKLKYSVTFSATANSPVTINHNLNTSDITYTIRDGYNFVSANLELDSGDPNNSVIITTTGTVSSGRINIIG